MTLTLTLKQLAPGPRRPVQSGVWLPLTSSHNSPLAHHSPAPPADTLSPPAGKFVSGPLHLLPSLPRLFIPSISMDTPTLPSGPCLNSSPEKPPLSFLTSPQCSFSLFPGLAFPIAFVTVRHSLWFVYFWSLPISPS